MCRIEGAEPWDFFHAYTRPARKAHQCSECRRAIVPGEHYEAASGGYEGSTAYFKTCAYCIKARSWLSKNCGGFIYEQVAEELAEHAEEYPMIAAHIWLLVDGMRTGWRDAGSLPAMPPSIAYAVSRMEPPHDR